MDLNNNISMHEQLGHELRTKMHTNALESLCLFFCLFIQVFFHL
jgi:hypothetical protein